MTIQSVFEKAPGKFDGEKWGKGNAVIHFDLTGPEGGQYTAIIQDQVLRMAEGLVETPDLAISLDAGDLEDLLTGSLKPMQALMSGKIRLEGDKMIALKALQVFGI